MQNNQVQSVQRALKILGCFNLDHQELGITEIANQLGFNKSTVYRLLGTLESEGFVRKVNDNRYMLSWKMFELGMVVSAFGGDHQIILETLQSIVNQTGETAHLAVLDNGEVLYIEKIESPYTLRMPSSIGRRVPTHCTALGKVLLANLDDSECLSLIYGKTLKAFTKHTITNPDQLRQELQKIRTDGYAIDSEELELGLICIAAPIIDDKGKICGAVSIAGPSSRIEQNLESNIAALRKEAKNLSHSLGSKAALLSILCSSPSISMIK
jgi:DNA-binding IclR family transcriptional regulator